MGVVAACANAFGAGPVINGLSAADFDVSSTPPDVMNDQQLKKYWSIPQHDKKCFVYSKDYGAPLTMQLQLQPADVFAKVPESIYPPAQSLPACIPHGIDRARLSEPVTDFDPPAPLPPFDAKTVAEYKDHYGFHATEAATDKAGYWFATTLAKYRAFKDPKDARALIDTMLAWQGAGALTTNIQITGNSGSVIYSVSTNMATILTAYIDLAPIMTADERQKLGPWLNVFMKKVAGNSDQFRTQDHEMSLALLLAEWGLAVGDKAAVQQAIDRYKYAINDMRPDGVFVQDSSRGGSGINYQNLMTGDAVLLAAVLKTSLGLDLFSYTVSGRSIDDAVGYTLKAINDPVTYNKQNALPCPNASAQTVENPVTNFDLDQTFATSIYFPVYALLNPSSKYAAPITDQFGDKASHAAFFNEAMGAAPMCMFSLKPPGFAETAKPRSPAAITTTEEFSYPKHEPNDFDAIWISADRAAAPAGKTFEYNIIGTYSPGLNSVAALQFVVNAPIGKTEPAAMSHCGSGDHTVTYGDGQKRVLIDFLFFGGNFRSQNVKCILAALPKGDAAAAVSFLTTRFHDVAQGLVDTGDVALISDEHLRQWLADVASGKVQVQ